jgi:UDP-3-O-[3-hydroxymyristoyl] glucosamine N-acyltransferase
MQLSSPISIETLQQYLNITTVVEGLAQEITGINEIHKVTHGDLSFVDHPKYYDKALQSAASVVLINTTAVANPQQKTLLLSDDPFRDYNILVKKLSEPVVFSQAIDPTATVGKHSTVQYGAIIGKNVRIGEHCSIYPNVVIYDNAIIGNHVTIHANTVIGADAFYYKRRPEGYDKLHTCGRVIIHDHVEIGACCTIDRGVSGDTVIGTGTKIDNHIHIAHGVVIGNNCLIAAQVGIAGKTTIEDNVMLWGQVGVSKDLTIGKNAVVLAQSGVSKSLKGDKTYFGSPTEEVRQAWRNTAELRQIIAWWRENKEND